MSLLRSARPTVAETVAQRRTLYGLSIDAITLSEAVERCDVAVAKRQQMLVGVVNAAKIVNLRRDAHLRRSLLECDMILADGQSVVWASQFLGQPLPERVAGIELFESLLALADREHRSVYLLGARPEVLASLVDKVRERFPNLVVAGSRDGYFDDSEGASIAREIAASQADMLFLGMVSPKKEIFLGTYGRDLKVPVLHGVGGSFDVLAGVTQRAPRTWQRLGMEWAYRLKQEPGRLWRRYARTNSRFIAQTIVERFRPTAPWPRTALSRDSRGEHL